LLAIDGYYGPDTEADVAFFNLYYLGSTFPDVVTTRGTWTALCRPDDDAGFHGTYWQDAGCPAIIFLS